MSFIKNFNWTNKKVLVRCELNVPVEKGKILDDFRIKESIPTIRYLLKKRAKIILISHLGRPVGNVLPAKRSDTAGLVCNAMSMQTAAQNLAGKSSIASRPKGFDLKQYSLKPVAQRLEKLLNKKVCPAIKKGLAKPQFNRVKFINDCLGEKVKEEIEKMKSGEIILLENLRFYNGEEENDKKFAKALSQLGDVYINDALGACHRRHASIVGLPKFLFSGSGLLLEKEIKNLSKLIKKPKKPLIVIIGGAKIETKIKLIEKFLKNCNYLLIGGALASAILKEKRQKTFKFSKKQSLFFNSKKICLPIDLKVSKRKDGQGPYRTKELNEIKKDDYVFDIGPRSQKFFKEKILKARTIFWNGPLGLIEKKQFTKGTENIAKAIALSKGYKVVGGGDLVAFLNKLKLLQKINHISTGGGAMLAFLSGEKLPGIVALKTCKL